jgi:farnesyl diphosphate synthase
VRAALLMGAYRAVGGDSPAIDGAAAAIEIVHTLSLVHDDLPCMDDDDLRRGRPTTHRRFDVPTATGSASCSCRSRRGCWPRRRRTWAFRRPPWAAWPGAVRAGGIEGVVGGQWLDLEAERRTLALPELIEVHRGKTGALIRTACTLGGIAGEAGPAEVAALTAYGEEVGLAFQIADDVLDATGTSEALGKTAGRDAALAKSTYVSRMGVKAAREEADRLARRAVAHLEAAGWRVGHSGIGGYIVTRSS